MMDNVKLTNLIEKINTSISERTEDLHKENEKLEELNTLLCKKYEALNTHLTELSKMAGEDEDDILKKIQSIARQDGDPSEIVELMLAVIQDFTDLIDTKDMALDKIISTIDESAYLRGQTDMVNEITPLLPKIVH